MNLDSCCCARYLANRIAAVLGVCASAGVYLERRLQNLSVSQFIKTGILFDLRAVTSGLLQGKAR